MLLRFVAENFLSFKEATELNTFTSSKSQALPHHKVKCGHVEVLRLNAIYGANAAGKSNLIKALSFLQQWMLSESLEKSSIPYPFTFKLDKDCAEAHSAFAVEFCVHNQIYYYQIEFDASQIYEEELLRSGRSKDYPIFSRKGKEVIWQAEDRNGYFNKQFIDLLSRMLRDDMPMLTFMGKYYPELSSDTQLAYFWFSKMLNIVEPTSFPGSLPHFLDIFPEFSKLSQRFLRATNSGIVSLNVKKEEIDDDASHYDNKFKEGVDFAKKNPDQPYTLISPANRNLINIVYEHGKMVKKTMTITHLTKDGEKVDFDYIQESDGTRRLIEYLPILSGLMNPAKAVYVVDEIERSIHPVLMKKMLEIISAQKNLQGQLIFTTHDDNLLDQKLLRPDEIWMTQKDIEQSTHFYPLSDYHIHHTANIQNGYMDGRYGGIPLVNKLDDFGKEDL